MEARHKGSSPCVTQTHRHTHRASVEAFGVNCPYRCAQEKKSCQSRSTDLSNSIGKGKTNSLKLPGLVDAPKQQRRSRNRLKRERKRTRQFLRKFSTSGLLNVSGVPVGSPGSVRWFYFAKLSAQGSKLYPGFGDECLFIIIGGHYLRIDTEFDDLHGQVTSRR